MGVIRTVFLVVSAVVLISALFAFVSYRSHAVQNYLVSLITENGVQVASDVSYGPEPRHKMDVYAPEGGDPGGPVVVFYYGGGWKNGRKELYAYAGAAFAKQGYVTVVPDYRLYPEVKFPSFVEDAALAYSAVWNMVNKGKDTQRPIIVIGHSAGAHIAALISYDGSYVARVNEDAKLPSGFAGLAGPYAFDPTTWPTTKHMFDTAHKADDARPIAFVDRSSPKTLMIHGVDDTVVRLWNAEDTKRKLEQSGVEHRLMVLPDMGHLGVVTTIAKPLRHRSPVFETLVSFVKSFKD